MRVPVEGLNNGNRFFHCSDSFGAHQWDGCNCVSGLLLNLTFYSN